MPREELFLATKCWTTTIHKGPEAVQAQLEKTLKDLGVDYIDLYCIHWPVPGKHVAAYQQLEKAQAAGLVRKKQPAVRPAEERSPVALVVLSLVAAASLSAYVVQHCRRQPAVDPRRRRLVEMKAGSSSSDPKCRPV